jgi:hypothetical protein
MYSGKMTNSLAWVSFRCERSSRLKLPFHPAKTSKQRIDYDALQQCYAKMLSDGPFKTQKELARHMGVSRVWVSRVLQGIKRRAS